MVPKLIAGYLELILKGPILFLGMTTLGNIILQRLDRHVRGTVRVCGQR